MKSWGSLSLEQKKAYSAKVKKYRAAHPEKVQKWLKTHRKTEKYKMRQREYGRKRWKLNPEKMLNTTPKGSRRHLPAPTRPCPNQCELCGKNPDGRVLQLDHDHKTNKFRGWLCRQCNLSLGKFGDDLEGLECALTYLHRNQQNLFPVAAEDRKNIPIVSGVLNYFPSALIEIARVSDFGNRQHNPGQPLHWSRAKSSDHADTIGRHLMERGGFDTDGMRHSAKLAWRALALLQLELEGEGAPLARGARLPEKP